MKYLPILLLLCVIPAHAQTVYECRPQTKSCQSYAKLVQHLSGTVPLKDWHFVLADRKTFEAIKESVGSPNTGAAFTIPITRTTFLSQDWVISMAGHPQELRHILEHEAGHIACNCEDEWRADHAFLR